MASAIVHASLFLVTLFGGSMAQTAPGGGLLASKLKPLNNQQYNDFDWKLSRVIDATEKTNFVVSPLSVKLAISMLYSGLQGPAAKEIEDALSINATLKETVEQKFSNILKSLEAKEAEYELNIGTKLFVDLSTKINPEFEKKVTEFYDSHVQPVDFMQHKVAANEINEWCKKISKGKISQLVDENDITESTVMMLLNAIYFRGEWENQFPETATKFATFWAARNKPVTVQKMHIKEKFEYFNMQDVKAHLIRLPYMGKKFAMYIIYPYDVDGLPALAKSLGPEILSKAINNKAEQLISLQLPKFKFETTAELVPALQQINIKELFSGKANLQLIGSSPKGPLMISNILQKSGIEVNEKGSTAYASTNIVIDSRFGNDAIDINISHPFLFLIADEVQNNTIFIGKVVDPSTYTFPPPPLNVPPPASSAEVAPTDNTSNRIKPSPPENLIDKFNYFDKELLLKTAQSKINENIVLSPASIKTVLALLLDASTGNTEKELKDAMRLPKNKAIALSILQAQFNSLKNANSAVTVESRNKLFLAPDEKLSQRYAEVLQQQYATEFENVNFVKQDEAVGIINKWGNEVTKGLINSLVTKDNLDASTRLFLANCIYFKGDWQIAFDPKQTYTGYFENYANTQQKTKYMTAEMFLNYHEDQDLDAKIVEIPFKDARYTFTIILPNKIDGVYQVLKDLQHGSMLELFSEMKPSQIRITIPQTSVEFKTPLAEVLEQLDVKDLFSPNAQLNGMLEMNKPILIRDILHRAKIEINEAGAQAAASTGAGVVLLSASASSPHEFFANHPFVFFIRDTYEPGFLFEGVVMLPDKSGDPITQLDPPTRIDLTRVPENRPTAPPPAPARPNPNKGNSNQQRPFSTTRAPAPNSQAPNQRPANQATQTRPVTQPQQTFNRPSPSAAVVAPPPPQSPQGAANRPTLTYQQPRPQEKGSIETYFYLNGVGFRIRVP